MRAGAMTVRGNLPPEVIQRLVRRSFTDLRRVYEKGLRSNPTLQGRVVMSFVIDEQGRVLRATSAGSDLPDSDVISQVTQGISRIVFPSPEGGQVSVVLPIVFRPCD